MQGDLNILSGFKAMTFRIDAKTFLVTFTFLITLPLSICVSRDIGLWPICLFNAFDLAWRLHPCVNAIFYCFPKVFGSSFACSIVSSIGVVIVIQLPIALFFFFPLLGNCMDPS